MQEVEEASSLLATGGDGGPHPFVITLATFAARALRDLSIDHAMANLLLRMIVGRLDPSLEHKPKIVLRQIIRLDFVRIFGLETESRRTAQQDCLPQSNQAVCEQFPENDRDA